MKIFFSILLPTIIFISACSAQIPGVRNGHNMVYDPKMHAIILFGGANGSKVLGDTWSYANGKWAKLSEDGPSPRTFPAMVMADDYILVFGGSEVLFGNDQHPVRYLDDTWIYLKMVIT